MTAVTISLIVAVVVLVGLVVVVAMAAANMSSQLTAQRDELARLYVSGNDSDAPSEYRENKARLIADEIRVNFDERN